MDEQQALLPYENRDRLMREAVREFADHGYAGASTNRIVRRVGVAKGSLFYHFGSKERLYLAVLDASAERLRGAVEVAMHEPPEDPVERIVALARAEFRFYAAHPDLHRLLHRAVTDPDTRDMISERYAESATTQFVASVGGASFAESVDEPAAIAVLAWVEDAESC